MLSADRTHNAMLAHMVILVAPPPPPPGSWERQSRELRTSFDDVNTNAMESNTSPGAGAGTGLSLRGAGGSGSLLPDLLEGDVTKAKKGRKIKT